MSDLKICRICLRTQCKVYKFDRYQLKAYYEEVMAQKVTERDAMPHYFCYECATMLHKFHKFKEKCYTGLMTLKQISWKGLITYETVHDIDRVDKKLLSPLEILTVTKRVKTYIVTEMPESNESDCESVQAEDEKEVTLTDIENQNQQVFLNEGSISDNCFESDVEQVEDTKNIDLVENAQSEMNESKDIKENVHNTDNNQENVPSSPETVFVDVKEDVISLKSIPVRIRRKSFSEYGLKKTNPKFAKRRTRFLDSSKWDKYSLSEEIAIKQFQLKAKNPKYSQAAYKCDDCFKGFSREEMLKRHRQLTHCATIGSLECRFCHKRFKWDCKLRKHMRSHFIRFKCLQCDIVLCEENTAIMHEDYHKGVIKKCVHCGEEFKHPSTYYTHLRTHRSDDVCTICGMSFVSSMGLHMHKRIMHCTNEIESPDDDEEVNTFCEKCDITFETRKAYEEHLFHSAMHTESFQEEVDEYPVLRKVLAKKAKATIKQMLKRKRPNDEDPPLPKKGRKATLRKQHRKPTSCHQCGKHFETQAECMKHHLAEHPRTSFFSPSDRYICEVCGASLAPGSIATHQNMHTRQREYPCDTCGRRFHSSVGLKRHLVTHTGEKPFACTLCDKRFTQSNSMKLHYKTFHLKQPYPKRNRRKKKEDLPTRPSDDKSSSEDSEDSLPARPAPDNVHPDSQGDMHYLTLS